MFLDRKSIRKLAIGFAAATELVIYSISGLAIGYFLDHWLAKTEPWLTVLFMLLGFIAGMFRLYRIFERYDDSDADKDEK